MKNLLPLFTLILINTAAFADTHSGDSLTFKNRYGKMQTIAKEGYINDVTCIVQKVHVCIDNSCHNEECGCGECENDATDKIFVWVMGILFGFMFVILFFFAIQNGMFSIKRL